MKLRQVGAWILILTICLLTGCGQSAEQSSAQTESSDVSQNNWGRCQWRLLSFLFKENDELKGFEIDVWNRIAEENNWKIDYTIRTFLVCLECLIPARLILWQDRHLLNNETRREKYLFSGCLSVQHL